MSWFNQKREIEDLKKEVARQKALIASLRAKLGADAAGDDYGVDENERFLVRNGKNIAAVKAYRERTGADLVTAKAAIDSIS